MALWVYQRKNNDVEYGSIIKKIRTSDGIKQFLFLINRFLIKNVFIQTDEARTNEWIFCTKLHAKLFCTTPPQLLKINSKKTTRFFISKLKFDLLIKTFLRNQCFINKIFLMTFLILVVLGNFRVRFEENFQILCFLYKRIWIIYIKHGALYIVLHV